jgi:hypothetical protein
MPPELLRWRHGLGDGDLEERSNGEQRNANVHPGKIGMQESVAISPKRMVIPISPRVWIFEAA